MIGCVAGRYVLSGQSSAESGGYHGENHHFFGRIWNKGYHGSVGTSRWFCKIYHDKATIVRLLLKQLFFVDSFFPHHSCKVSQKENRATQFINERTARLKGERSYQPISALHAILKGITRIKAGIKSTRGTDLILETRKPAAIVKMPPQADKSANIVGVK